MVFSLFWIIDDGEKRIRDQKRFTRFTEFSETFKVLMNYVKFKTLVKYAPRSLIEFLHNKLSMNSVNLVTKNCNQKIQSKYVISWSSLS